MLQLHGVPLQLGQIVEGIDAVKFAGVDEAHEQVPHLRSLPGLIKQLVLVKQLVLAVKNGFLQCSLDQIVVDRGSGFSQKQGEFFPMFEQIGDGETAKS